jgi:ribonucleotide monophosphatase NagD (HAD superfamily)
MLPPPPCYQIVASSYAAAAYLRSQGFSSTLQPGKRALVFGSPGLQQELAAAGIPLLPGAQLQLPPMTDPAAMMAVEVGPTACLPACLGVDCAMGHHKTRC